MTFRKRMTKIYLTYILRVILICRSRKSFYVNVQHFRNRAVILLCAQIDTECNQNVLIQQFKYIFDYISIIRYIFL